MLYTAIFLEVQSNHRFVPTRVSSPIVWRRTGGTRARRLIRMSSDPVAQLQLCGMAETLREAEELYLNSCLPDVLGLLQSELSDEELGRHPLMRMLRSHGSRWWEEAID
jgi:hypothetical protein